MAQKSLIGTDPDQIPTCGMLGQLAFAPRWPMGSHDEVRAPNSVASAPSIDLTAAVVRGNLIHITGTVSISTITLPAGAERTCIADGAFTLVHSAALVVPGKMNYQVAVGDSFTLRGDSNGVVVTGYTRADGLPVVGTGAGGATTTGNVSLTSASAGNLIADPATPGLYATLPDATTCNKAALVFTITNNGGYDYGIKDANGTRLGWVRPFSTCIVGLQANGTAAGVWTLSNAFKIGTTAIMQNTILHGSARTPKVFALDANRTAILFDNYAPSAGAAGLYLTVYDASTRTFGLAVLVRSSTAGITSTAIVTQANQLLIVSTISASIEVVTASISGSSVTLNNGSKVAITSANGMVNGLLSPLVAVGASYVFGYINSPGSTYTAVRAITLSGTAPTLGAEYTCGNGSPSHEPALFVSGSVLRVMNNENSQVFCQPYTVSGTSLVAGTPAAHVHAGGSVQRWMLGSGNILNIYYYGGTMLSAALFKLTGTTETVSKIDVHAASGGGLAVDTVAISPTKVALLSYANGYPLRAVILTDTAGSLSAGASLDLPASAVGSLMAIGLHGGNLARFWLNTGQELVFECSGASPVLAAINKAPYSGFTPIQMSASTGRSFRLLTVGTTVYFLGNGAQSQSGADRDLMFVGPAMASVPGLPEAFEAGCAGTSTTEAWVIHGPVGNILKRIEVAA